MVRARRSGRLKKHAHAWTCTGRPPDLPTGPVFFLHHSLYNNIKTPGQLQPAVTFMLFKTGIVPKWEDPKNENGGCWTASLAKTGNAKQQIDAWWLNAVRISTAKGVI